MIDTFFNGLGALFVINLLAWLQFLVLAFVVFGCIYAFVSAIRFLFGINY